MDEAGLLDCLNKEEQQFIYVEYGAGKAGLSHFVSSRLGIKYNEFPDKALGKQMQKGSRFVVIDRDARRNKKDKFLRASGFECERYRMDIADFDIVKYLDHIQKTTAKEKQVNIVGIAKHLCGGATDLTLTSI